MSSISPRNVFLSNSSSSAKRAERISLQIEQVEKLIMRKNMTPEEVNNEKNALKSMVKSSGLSPSYQISLNSAVDGIDKPQADVGCCIQ